MKLKTFTLTIIMLCAAISIFAQGKTKTSETNKDEAMIRANVKQMETGWNAKSGAEFAKPFAEDSDFVIINGMHIKGRAANANGHQQIFDTIYKDSRLAATVKQIRFLRPDVAVVHIESNLTFKLNGEEKKGNGFVTLVMTREKGKWSIAAFQNTAIQPPAEQ